MTGTRRLLVAAFCALMMGATVPAVTLAAQPTWLTLSAPETDVVEWPARDSNGLKRARAPRTPTTDVLTNGSIAGPLAPLGDSPLDPSVAQGLAQAALTPRIVAQAAALGGDARRIFNFVKTQIAFDPIFGLLRSPDRVLLERAGTDADQAVLLAQLLQAAGLTTELRYGTVTVPLDQAAAWVRVQPGTVSESCNRVYGALISGGHPVPNVQPCPSNKFIAPHVWVKATQAGNTYELDPSFKRNLRTPSIDLRGALGYDRTAFLAAAEDGATVTSSSISGLNRSRVASKLEGYAANLVAHIEANQPNAFLQDVVGGWSISEPAVAALPAALPYASSVTHTFADPSSPSAPRLHHGVTVSVGGTALGLTSTIADLAGRRLTYTYAGGLGTLRLDGTSLGSAASPATQGVTYCFDAPFDAAFGAYADECTTRTVVRAEGNTYAFVTDAGRAPAGLVSERRELIALNRGTFSDSSDEVRGETLNALGLSWFDENGAAERLHDAVAGVNGYRFHGMAVMAQEQGAAGPVFGIDVRLNLVHTYSPISDSIAEAAHFSASAAQGSGIEHGFLEQLQGTEGISTIRVFDQAAVLGIPIFQATPANWATVRPQLSYGASTLSALDSAIAAGFSLVVPRANVTLNQWSGTGWIQFTSTQEGYIISGGLNGGYSTEPGEIDPLLFIDDLGRIIRWTVPAFRSARELDPVDPATGAFTFDALDFVVAGAPPLSVGPFARTYNSGAALGDGPAGFGWSHSFDQRLRVRTDYYRGLEGPAAVDAARSVAAVYAAEDMAKAALAEHERRAVGAAVVTWGMDQLVDNTLSLSGATSGVGVSLPGGRYSRSSHFPFDVTTNADGSRSLRGSGGLTHHFEPVAEPDGSTSWRLAAIADDNANRLTLTYDAAGPAGRVVSVRDAVGRTYQLAYTGPRLSSVTNPRGDVRYYSYDGLGNLVKATDPRGGVESYTYDARHRMLGYTDQSGAAVLANTYDATGRTVGQRDALGRDSALAYGEGVTRVTDPLGRAKFIEPLGGARGLRTTDEVGGVTTIAYDAARNIVAVTDPMGTKNSFTHDYRGNRLSHTDPLGRVSTASYDARDRPVLVRDPANQETALTYDAEGNLVSRTNALGQTTSFVVDGAGRMAAVVEAVTGARTQFGYDALGHTASITNPAGQVGRFDHDVLGRPVLQVDQLGATTTFRYDAAGNLLRSVDPLGREVVHQYDSVNQLIASTDNIGRIQTNTYDAAGNIVRTTRTDGSVVRFEYDALNRIVAYVDPVGNRWVIERDAAGRVVAEIDPHGNRRLFARDAAGRVTSRTDAEGRITTYTYDAAGRIVEAVYADGKVLRTGYTPDGLVSTSSLGGWSVDLSYDAIRRVTTESYPALGRVVRHTYDQQGSNVSMGDRVGLELIAGGETKESTSFAYDPAHRLTAMTTGAGQTTYSYDGGGRLVRTAMPNGATVTQSYDAASQILQVENRDAASNSFARYDYDYDVAGRVSRMTQTSPLTALATNYSYDGFDRLLEERTGRQRVAYTYDAAGNRLTRTDAAGTTSYDYGAANELLSAGAASFTHDRDGNLVAKTTPAGTTSFTWDQENRLTRINPPTGPPVEFAYDGVGRQISRTESGVPAHDTYDGLRLLAEGSANLNTGAVVSGGIRSVEHSRRLGGPAGPTAVTSFAVDRQRGVSNLVDGNGKPRDAYRGDAFGYPSAPAGAAPNQFRFGGSLGAETEPSVPGLVRMGFRYYDSDAGRFISRDPLGFLAGEPNLYGYVGSSPTNDTDSTGLFWDTILDIGFIAYDIYKIATEGGGENGINYIALGADIGGALIPFATGVGHATRAGAALPKVTRAAGQASDLTVIGHYPEYTQLADRLGANRFQVPQHAWDRMSAAEQWAANQRFLDRAINRGSEIRLATPLDRVRPGSAYERELRYLAKRGVSVTG